MIQLPKFAYLGELQPQRLAYVAGMLALAIGLSIGKLAFNSNSVQFAKVKGNDTQTVMVHSRPDRG